VLKDRPLREEKVGRGLMVKSSTNVIAEETEGSLEATTEEAIQVLQAELEALNQEKQAHMAKTTDTRVSEYHVSSRIIPGQHPNLISIPLFYYSTINIIAGSDKTFRVLEAPMARKSQCCRMCAGGGQGRSKGRGSQSKVRLVLTKSRHDVH